jgi:hypothetical protein
MSGHQVLDDVVVFLRRFVSLSDAQATVIMLWVVHTHAIKAAYTTPYLSITSAEKQCGKTRLLEVLSLLVSHPWFTGSTSKAALVRKLDQDHPTLLLDESDAAFARDKEYSEALRAVLNCGHSRDVDVVSLCVGHAADMTVKDFHVFGPKAIAGIGKLPDTVADRSIPIRMKRRASKERVERFRRRHLKGRGDEMQKRIAAWITPDLQQLRDANPDLPDVLSDRQLDGCEPLVAIADHAGEDWPEKARNALVEILTGDAAEDGSIGVRLLSDIRDVFNQKAVESLSTSELLIALCDHNPLWSEFHHGKPLGAAGLSRLLKAYDIDHHKLRIGAATPWGYRHSAFEDAWRRYLRCNLEQVEQCSNDAVKTPSDNLEQKAYVPASENRAAPADMRVVPDVPVDRPNRVGTDDYLFNAAVARCRGIGQASVSDLVTAIGLTRSVAIQYMDEMERRGLILPANGSGPRPFSPTANGSDRHPPTASDLGFSDSC